jgi:hypothetical protein
MGLDMLDSKLADELTRVAGMQLSEGIRAKEGRMRVVSEIMDLYNNKTLEVQAGMVNIPFPTLAGHIDLMQSKIDEAPTLTFKVPNKPSLTDKVMSAWIQESSSTRSGWKRKDRAEKKAALLSGRGIAKVFASSVGNEYRSHFEVVDFYSFVADPTRGFLEDGNYHGETDIFKTADALRSGARAGVYSTSQVARLLSGATETQADGNVDVTKNKFDRLRTLGIDVETTSFAGQAGKNMTEWVMRHDGEWYYLLFEPKSLTWVRAERLRDVFANGKTPYVSWATHYDEFAFWTKGSGDDVYPIAEAIRLILNTALENEKRRGRPMRIVDSGALVDINELQDYVPDNVIVRNPGRDPNVVTVETPETTTTIDMAMFLDRMIQSKSGVSEPGTSESDPKVGVFYGKLQQEADRIGVINKEYSESYAHKGYRFFWGLKQHLTKPKQVEMLGKGGVKLQLMDRFDFKDVDDVDDVIVSGGSRDAETTAVESQKKVETLNALAAAFPDKLNPLWIIRQQLSEAGYEDDQIEEAMDVSVSIHKESSENADSAIQSILLGDTPNLYMAADKAFADRIIRFVREEMNYVELDKNGNEKGIDKSKKKQADLLLAFVGAHVPIIAGNTQRQAEQMAQAAPTGGSLQLPVPGQEEAQAAAAMPGEMPAGMAPAGTPMGTAAASQGISNAMSP